MILFKKSEEWEFEKIIQKVLAQGKFSLFLILCIALIYIISRIKYIFLMLFVVILKIFLITKINVRFYLGNYPVNKYSVPRLTGTPQILLI